LITAESPFRETEDVEKVGAGTVRDSISSHVAEPRLVYEPLLESRPASDP
jgi:hypothetical protein